MGVDFNSLYEKWILWKNCQCTFHFQSWLFCTQVNWCLSIGYWRSESIPERLTLCICMRVIFLIFSWTTLKWRTGDKIMQIFLVFVGIAWNKVDDLRMLWCLYDHFTITMGWKYFGASIKVQLMKWSCKLDKKHPSWMHTYVSAGCFGHGVLSKQSYFSYLLEQSIIIWVALILLSLYYFFS